MTRAAGAARGRTFARYGGAPTGLGGTRVRYNRKGNPVGMRRDAEGALVRNKRG